MNWSQSSFFDYIATIYLKTVAEKKLFWIAVEHMSASVDPLHDEKHIEAMLRRLDLLIKKKLIELDAISLRNLILSIVWHDVWVSQYHLTWVLKMWATQVIEGIAGARLFLQHARKFRLPESQALACAYAIRKHSNYQLLELKTEIAKILYDLDWLEFYSVHRFKETVKILKKRGQILIFERSWLHAAIGNLYMKLRASNPGSFYHDWARTQFNKNQAEYFLYAQQFQEKARQNSFFSVFLKYF